MKGCNKFCSYCVVPQTRGLEICRPIEKIIASIKSQTTPHTREIVLLGQSVNHYYYRNINFYKLLYIVSKIVPANIRIKFFTSYPKNIVYPLLNIIKKEKNLAKYLHIPIQSGSNLILKKMNRCYTREQYLNIIKTAYKKVPNICIAGDMIVGFPGERTTDFQNSVTLVRQIKYRHLFIAQYSPRPRTTAYTYYKDNIPKSIKKARHKYLLKVQNNIIEKDNISWLSKIVEGLVYEVYNNRSFKKKTMMLVKSYNEKIVFLFDDQSLLGSNVLVKIVKVNKLKIFGILVSKI
jgi:tRNA-2-methylthio-N6-dimethylallyladenosine synthase